MRVLQSIKLMDGQLLIQLFDDRPAWQVRLYDRRHRRYITRSLRTTDQIEATNRAIKLWHEMMPRIEADISADPSTLEALVEQYLEAGQKRVEAGEIQAGAVRDQRAQLKVVLTYARIKNLRKVTDVQAHSFNDFIAWRRDESLAITTGKAGIMRRGSVNKAVRELRAWWKWVRSQKQSTVDLEVKELSTRKEEIRQRNIAFTERDWNRIQQELQRWVFTEAKGPEWKNARMRPIHWYGRRNFYYLLMCLILCGARPQELTNIVTWGDLVFQNEGKTKAAREQDARMVIRIRNPEGKGSRSVATNAGVLLKTFRKYADQWRLDNGYPQIKDTDLVFAYPPSNEAYAYSHYGNLFRALLKRLRLEGKGYTIRSCRATYITDQLAAGKAPYIVARNCGHDIKVMLRDYEQLNEQQLVDELL